VPVVSRHVRFGSMLSKKSAAFDWDGLLTLLD
jgi:hypothetical protein